MSCQPIINKYAGIIVFFAHQMKQMNGMIDLHLDGYGNAADERHQFFLFLGTHGY
jgi:hypothetical protein